MGIVQCHSWPEAWFNHLWEKMATKRAAILVLVLYDFIEFGVYRFNYFLCIHCLYQVMIHGRINIAMELNLFQTVPRPSSSMA